MDVYEGFRHTNRVLGTGSTEAIKVAQSHQKRTARCEEKRVCEAEKQCRKRKAKTNLMGHHQIPDTHITELPLNEPRHEKTNNVVFEQARHKPNSTGIEDG